MPMILCKWEKLIASLNPINLNGATLTNECVQSLINQSEEERERVKDFLIEYIVNRGNGMDKRQYIQFHQTILIRMMNQLYAYRQRESITDEIMQVCNVINAQLKDSLDFIENFFDNYFNRNEKVPADYFDSFIEQLSDKSEVLKERLELHNTVDNELINILLNNFNKFRTENVAGATYCELAYHEDLTNELLHCSTLDSEIRIREVLFYFNFNNDDYVTYLCKKWATETENFETKVEKIAALRFEQKNINQLRTKLNCCYCSSVPSLKEQSNNWFEEEIKFLERNSSFQTVEKKQIESDGKIHTSLSVAKLALLIRLMVMDKIITNRVVAPLLRIVVKMFTTLQTESIAFGSLETKYHNPDRGTISAVKDMLFRWINILNKQL